MSRQELIKLAPLGFDLAQGNLGDEWLMGGGAQMAWRAVARNSAVA